MIKECYVRIPWVSTERLPEFLFAEERSLRNRHVVAVLFPARCPDPGRGSAHGLCCACRTSRPGAQATRRLATKLAEVKAFTNTFCASSLTSTCAYLFTLGGLTRANRDGCRYVHAFGGKRLAVTQ